jgi:16S rRNA (cytosine1402-N4)-methyltransferase
MDRSQGVSAAELVNNESVENLTAIFRELGEEPQARGIAQARVRARDAKRIVTTADLAGIVERAAGRHTAHHPATKVFQALRMAVNDEVGELKRALEQGLGLLNGAGRFAVITFESITDRIVKRFFAAHAGRMVSLQGGGEQWEGELPKVRAVFKKVVTATEDEVNLNPRSRSAKLRVVEKESN